MTFKEIGQRFLSEQEEKLALTTYEKYSSILEKYVFPSIGELNAEEIDNEVIKNMIVSISTDEANTGREGGSLKSGTLKLIDQVTRMVVDYSRNDGDNDRFYIRHNDSKSFERLTPLELERVCSCAYYNHTPEMLGVLLMLYTGIRIGELCALSCDDIDLENCSVYIHRSVHRVKNKDKDAREKTQNVIATIPSKKQIRTVQFPEVLLDYVKEFYAQGFNLMTANALPAEAKTVRDRVNRVFDVYRIENIPFQRLHRTYTDGAADIEILMKVFRADGSTSEELDKEWLCQEMVNDLKSLRLLIGVTALEMSNILGVKKEEYLKIENGENGINWNEFMTLLFFFNYNEKTASVVDSLGLYPTALKMQMNT